ncbi:unnamed protein product [Sphenostylis stenocarpa]|uniref:Peptidase metallopeptidase domain-containing protein n=1 Tax=Sphenostylis stenocarpa TaxID=92480 RepID=A0AA86T2S3_9FABA|nr:unnamed protein product [Sphenostylis stenocarpa]
MKPYILTFLLFLLLADKSHAKGGVRSSLRRGLFRSTGGGVIGFRWHNTVNNVEQQELSPPPPTKQVKGLSRIKDYFSDFGYLQSSPPFNDSLDHQTRTAIKSYQRFFNLNPTGDLTNETFHKLSLPRCGVPDVNFEFSAVGNVSWPKAGRRWFSGMRLTYGFFPASRIPGNATEVFRRAFARWGRAVPGLNLTEGSYDEADIRVGFYDLDEGVEDVVWGESVVRLRNGMTGEIRLDASKEWRLAKENGSVLGKEGALDLESVAMHQIGHLLGLDHSNVEESVMYPYVLPSKQRKVELSVSDKVKIQGVLSHGNSGHGEHWGVSLTITALGFMLILA